MQTAATSHICHTNTANMITCSYATPIVMRVLFLWISNCLWKQMVVWAPAMLSVKTISILLVLLTRNIFAYFDRQTNENNTPMCRVWSALKSASTFVISFWSSLNPEEALFRLHFGLAGGELFFYILLWSTVWPDFRLTRGNECTDRTHFTMYVWTGIDILCYLAMRRTKSQFFCLSQI